MAKTAQELRVNYTRVVVMRNDVFFVTPMDIRLTKNNTIDKNIMKTEA